ncbi:hypothetical protein SSX86_015550 [Deinandra increscens subsp. villosa]|uniref:U3 small nucleolar RNA-associated protein 6 homolog n=1 Tax=Deinandra increscens subsp. villosa TaxID=3103831 RepID=A0AAP0GZ57_9ASTR
MADVVQYKLERMVNELDDLERRGLFSRREIAEIVKQRRKFEYRLKRPSPLKEDFLAYIDYEKSVDALRLLRKKAVTRELQKSSEEGAVNRSKKTKQSYSDFAGISRILDIYRLATNRFKGDRDLWFQYLDFCKQRRNGRIRKVLVDVVRFHSKEPEVWMYTASFLFDHDSNVAAARAFMLSGLRVCPTYENLWVEYLRMELTYLNKLTARKAALGEDVGALVLDSLNPEDKEWRDENKDLFMSIIESEDFKDVQNEELKQKIDIFQKQGLNIFQAIYKSAVEKLPSSFSLRTQFLEILETTNLSDSENMQKEILADMRNEFSKEPAYWDWLAKYETSGRKITQDERKEITTDQLFKAIQVYDEALKIVPTSTMFDLCTKFLMDVIGTNGHSQSSSVSDSSDNYIDPVTHVLMIFDKAQSMGCVSEYVACQYVSFLLQLGRSDDARNLAEIFCNGELSESVNLWVLRLSIEMKRFRTPSKADLSYLFDLLQNPLRKFSVLQAETLWHMGLKYFSNHKHYFDKLVDISLSSLIRDGGSDDGFSLSSTIVNFALQKNGIQSARDMYKRFLALPRPGLALYRTCIEMEQNLASFAGSKEVHLVEARKLYEAALSAYDQDVSLWQDYHSMESQMGTSETAAAISWRARKTLKNIAMMRL